MSTLCTYSSIFLRIWKSMCTEWAGHTLPYSLGNHNLQHKVCHIHYTSYMSDCMSDCIWSLIQNNSFQKKFICKQTIIADTFFIITCLYNDHLFVTWFLWNNYTLNVFLKWIHYHGAGPENKCVNINVYTFVFGFMYSVIHVIYITRAWTSGFK